jgi:hypothetical protein
MGKAAGKLAEPLRHVIRLCQLLVKTLKPFDVISQPLIAIGHLVHRPSGVRIAHRVEHGANLSGPPTPSFRSMILRAHPQSLRL